MIEKRVKNGSKKQPKIDVFLKIEKMPILLSDRNFQRFPYKKCLKPLNISVFGPFSNKKYWAGTQIVQKKGVKIKKLKRFTRVFRPKINPKL